jgi:predicted TIM-barrel fold metal-dependent hydrolase
MTRGRDVGDRPIFDAHAHLAPGDGAVRRLLAEMDARGIDRALVVAGAVVSADRLARQIVDGGHAEDDADNDAVLAGCEQADGRLVPFFFANPHAPADVYRSRGPDFRGLKMAPVVHGVPFLDDRVVALVKVADDLGHSVYTHCLHRSGFGVRDLVALAQRFPATVFALGHCGVGDLDFYGIDLVEPVGNIVFETSCGLTATVRRALERLGPHRVMFGSEYPMQAPVVELTKIAALGLSAAEWEAVTWRTADEFVGEP